MTDKLFFKSTILFFCMLLLSCGSSKKIIITKNFSKNAILLDTTITETTFKTGAENHTSYLPFLLGKRVGIVTNQTGILSKEVHLVDFLVENNITVSKIFAPEHGFRGTADAGEVVVDGLDPKTGLPIISLYGKNKKPKAEQLADLDVLLFDIQDVGARFYTYISTLHYVMEACAEQNLELIVLDRPNPIGRTIDGPILEKEHKSFVGMHEIPVLHGMTIGEYALMINGEKWLNENRVCPLKIVPCLHYNKDMFYSLPINPSPNLPNDQAIRLYASLCFFEGTNVSVGRGTTQQFQIYGSPFLNSEIYKYQFIPVPNFGAKEPMHKDKICFGEDLSNYNIGSQIELKWLLAAYQNTLDKTQFFNDFLTKLAGTKQLRLQIEAGLTEKEIRKSWVEGLESFSKTRAKYVLYE